MSFDEFCELWVAVHEMSAGGKTPSDNALSLAYAILCHVPFDRLKQAVVEHSKRSKFAPTPSDIFELFNQSKPVHVGADEAWAIVLTSFDEKATVVMTREIAEARSIAYPVFTGGDKTGARMAFRDAYSRLIQHAGMPEWFVSEGFDKATRAVAVEQAMALGRLSHEQAARYLQALPVLASGVIAGLLSGAKVDEQGLTDATKRNLDLLKDALRNMEAKQAQRDQHAQAEKLAKKSAFEARKAEALVR